MQVSATKIGNINHYHIIKSNFAGRPLLKALRHDVRLGDRIFYIYLSDKYTLGNPDYYLYVKDKDTNPDIEIYLYSTAHPYTIILKEQKFFCETLEEVVATCEKLNKLIAFI